MLDKFERNRHVCPGFLFIKTDCITLTILHHTIPYSREVENWSKSDHVINAGTMYIRKSWPGSVTSVAWHGCSRDCGARGPGFDSGGTALFGGVS